MAGHVISLYLKEKGHEVIGFSRRPVDFVPCVCGDAMDSELLKREITSGQYDVIVNAIGILNQDADKHKDRAIYLNGYLPHQLALITANMSTRVFQMSTDCVFKGNTGPYTEQSKPDGETFYDRTKALGELNDDKNLTLRNSIIGPDINESGIGLFNWFMKQHGSVNGYTGAIWTGVTTIELAKAMHFAAIEGTVGLINMVPSSSINKFELLNLFNSIIRNDSVIVNPVNPLQLDKTLLRTNNDFSFRAAPYEEQIIEMKSWIQNHKDLYPHYFLEN